ncbi:MAG: hypothetical protein ACJ8H8_35685 [Geminicoccaceae bacterium]
MLDVQKVGKAIDALSSDNKADELWRAARNPRHPCHAAYEWDTAAAAEQHWLATSRHLIAAVWRISDEKPPEPVLISISVPESGRDYYRPQQVLDNARLQRLAAQQAQRDLEAWAKRHAMILRMCPNVAAARQSLTAYLADLGLSTEAA